MTIIMDFLPPRKENLITEIINIIIMVVAVTEDIIIMINMTGDHLPRAKEMSLRSMISFMMIMKNI